jgi:hypothetical protein
MSVSSARYTAIMTLAGLRRAHRHATARKPPEPGHRTPPARAARARQSRLDGYPADLRDSHHGTGALAQRRRASPSCAALYRTRRSRSRRLLTARALIGDWPTPQRGVVERANA